MARFRHAVLTVGFVLAVGAPARADDAADARKIIEKAVKAHGGQDKLDKLQGHTTKFKGNFHGMGQAIPMTGEVADASPKLTETVSTDALDRRNVSPPHPRALRVCRPTVSGV